MRLREAIQNRSLIPGTRVTELELAERLEMSRTPVREAIYRLETEGLFSHEPRRGLVVASPDHRTVLELYAMRETLEGAAAALAAQHASDIEIEQMKHLVAQEIKAAEAPDRLESLNRSFHGLIYVAANNRYLTRMLENLAATAALLPTMLTIPERANEAHAEHSAILIAISDREPVKAEQAARAHMRSAKRSRLTIIANQLGAP
ncbi:MAG: GntR family transcriptional regulator [Hoeflea sp.]|uniref:GntR family transcriptional regulator n=1 Tax=Hoeflea sp. TaxID=1940281 RepID=UPI001D959C95|nr:GntR family transcriptional regulator [Hoeflea sp.]MBU4529002.1 GntR family transcriptional regulator [Alphaproteobacteria bacterium]MBU4543407.1 GntR family transcriptional regulator [Alphaproteobacteria bacterium]MBU4549032.1 GntR family transcriptional regulator [Alphaproteobacteria bacterium]MBV1725167.1 GntR family transcriptional regulator [Hoeflea sp.]MBV1785128.1 GntR family transcriptional regulator [Hoeflea sp.]